MGEAAFGVTGGDALFSMARRRTKSAMYDCHVRDVCCERFAGVPEGRTPLQHPSERRIGNGMYTVT